VGKFVGADIIFIIEGYIGSQKYRGYGKTDYYHFGELGWVNMFLVKMLVLEIKTGEVIAYWHERKNFENGKESIQ